MDDSEKKALMNQIADLKFQMNKLINAGQKLINAMLDRQPKPVKEGIRDGLSAIHNFHQQRDIAIDMFGEREEVRDGDR
jgi:hypothetical protein